MNNKRLEFARSRYCREAETIGYQLIGGAYIHPDVYVSSYVNIGDRTIIHRGVMLGGQGFGFVMQEDGTYLHVRHIGGINIGRDVEIFEGCNIAVGTSGDTTIGHGTKIDAMCHIAHNVIIGENCLIAAGTHIAGSVTIEKGSVIGVGCTISDHVIIPERTFLGAGTVVIKDLIGTDCVWVGNPARFLRIRTKEDEL